MDESWRMRMGEPNVRTHHHRRRNSIEGRVSNPESGGYGHLEPDDFGDVFGGPPRSVLSRKLSADFTTSEWFYKEIFRQPETEDHVIMTGRRLPEFVIPEQRRSSKEKVKSISKSKSTCSSSVFTFAEVDDSGLSSFTSRLRPITEPAKWSSTSTILNPNPKIKRRELPTFGSSDTSHIDNDQFMGNDCDDYVIKSFKFGISEPIHALKTAGSNPSSLMRDFNMQPNSSSSSISCLNQDYKNNNFVFQDNMFIQQQACNVDVEDEAMSSYIIERNSHTSETSDFGAIAIDEAIAWAKERSSLRDEESDKFIEISTDY